MDVFLMVRRKYTTIFLDANENTQVLEVKKMVEGIMKVSVDQQQLLKAHDKSNEVMEDSKTLKQYGYTASIAKAQDPSVIGLVFMKEDDSGDFEAYEPADLSIPPPLPEVMQNQQSANPSAAPGQGTTAAASAVAS